MKAAQLAAIDAIRAEAEARGCTCEVIPQKSRAHGHVVVTAPDGRWSKLPVACTPGSDTKNVAKMKRQDTRRLLRTWGLLE